MPPQSSPSCHFRNLATCCNTRVPCQKAPNAHLGAESGDQTTPAGTAAQPRRRWRIQKRVQTLSPLHGSALPIHESVPTSEIAHHFLLWHASSNMLDKGMPRSCQIPSSPELLRWRPRREASHPRQLHSFWGMSEVSSELGSSQAATSPASRSAVQGAMPMTSVPLKATGHTCAWIGVGLGTQTSSADASRALSRAE